MKLNLSRSVFLVSIFSLGSLGCTAFRPNPKLTGKSPTSDTAYKLEPSTFDHRLQQQIQSYLGVPYLWGGVTRSGMDCSGFVHTVYRKATKLILPRKARSMFREGRYVVQEELRFGDLVFFEKIENYGVSHVGIYVGKNQFAHASTKKGVIISNLGEKYYRERYVGARRIYKR